jgi:plasmid stabilization system protein ParE
MIQVVISDDALDDLNVGFWFYETQQAGMGDYFADKLRNDIETLKQTGGSHRVTHENFHRAISRIFPYAIYYTCEGNDAIVWAVVDCRRDPDWILDRLNQ